VGADELKALNAELELVSQERERLQQELEATKTELAGKDAQISQLQQQVTDQDDEVASRQQQVTELEAALAAVREDLGQAVISYRELIIETSTGAVAALINGDTIPEIRESWDRAVNLISQVRTELEEEVAKTRVPAGAPQRTPPDLSTLSSREKISYAIGGRR